MPSGKPIEIRAFEGPGSESLPIAKASARVLENRTVKMRTSLADGRRVGIDAIERALGPNVLRWCVVDVSPEELTIEATFFDGLRDVEQSPAGRHTTGKSVAVSVIPTGIGCDVGGFAGDAGPATALLAATTDYLVTNPNAVNASDFIALPHNVVYTEGYCIDLLFRQRTRLRVPRTNRVGVIVEHASDRHLETVFNIINTVRAVYGVSIEHHVITRRKMGIRCTRNPSGAYVGTIDHPDVLFDACDALIARGVNAIAVTSDPEDLPTEGYQQHFMGRHPNPVGGVEAIVSHLVVNRYRLPAVHAPMLTPRGVSHLSGAPALTHENAIVDARGAGEISSLSGLACILVGLRCAPQLNDEYRALVVDEIGLENVIAVVAPASALGGIPVIAAAELGIPVIAVKDNSTVLNVTAERLGLKDVFEARSYLEAAGMLLALKSGISLQSVRRPLASLKPRLE